MLVLSLLSFLMTGALPPLDCPQEMSAKVQHNPDASEQWCESAEGVRAGPRRGFYPGAKRWFEGQYKGGQRVGKWLFFYESGSPMAIIHYKADKADGEFKRYSEAGPISKSGVCKAAKEEGLWRSYSPSGKPEVEQFFRKNKPPQRIRNRSSTEAIIKTPTTPTTNHSVGNLPLTFSSSSGSRFS